MKNIRVKTIEMSNFKGQTRTVAFNDGATVITGANGVGKTTVMKSFLWLLTGRTDAAGKTNSELFDNTTPLTPGTPEAVVAAKIEIDGVEHILARSAKAKFKRPKGQAEYVKDNSDEYKFFVDGMPYTATDFNGWVEAQIAPMGLLPIMLLGETFAILAENDKVKARKVLTDIIGEKTPNMGEFEAIKDDLASCPNISLLGDKYKTSIRGYNDKLSGIPEQLSVYKMNKEALTNQLADMKTDYDAEVKGIETEIESVKNEIERKNKDANDANENYRKLLMRQTELKGLIQQNKIVSEGYKSAVKNSEEYIEKTKEKIADAGVLSTVCPRCGAVVTMEGEEGERLKNSIEDEEKKIRETKEAIARIEDETAAMRTELGSIVLPEFVKTDTAEETDRMNVLYEKLSSAKANAEIVKAKRSDLDTCKAQIESLTQQQKTYGAELAKVEVKKMMLDDYQQKCAEMLSDEVNRLMTDTKIQMFEVQKNGEQKPSCTITNKDGVKYSTLNFSARILANIEISRMFCGLTGVSVPCFVDECSVFDSAHMPQYDDMQMVYIRCSDDEKLTVI